MENEFCMRQDSKLDWPELSKDTGPSHEQLFTYFNFWLPMHLFTGEKEKERLGVQGSSVQTFKRFKIEYSIFQIKIFHLSRSKLFEIDHRWVDR